MYSLSYSKETCFCSVYRVQVVTDEECTPVGFLQDLYRARLNPKVLNKCAIIALCETFEFG